MNIRRPRSGRILGGVCAGIARHYGWDVSTARLIALLTFFIPGPNVLIYLVLWVLMPSDEL